MTNEEVLAFFKSKEKEMLEFVTKLYALQEGLEITFKIEKKNKKEKGKTYETKKVG